MKFLIIGLLLLGSACAQPAEDESQPDAASSPVMTFFLTSAGPGDGARLGGLEGADAWCRSLAENAGAGQQDWTAYLSTGSVNARDRIGSGPWTNADGVVIATDLDHLHSDANNLTKETVLSESGTVVNGRGDTPNRHDILTGSQLDGTAFPDDGSDHTCGDWRSSDGATSASVGHHDRIGGGDNPTSWNSAHGTRGCSQEELQSTGGDGLFYCFATGR